MYRGSEQQQASDSLESILGKRVTNDHWYSHSFTNSIAQTLGSGEGCHVLVPGGQQSGETNYI